MTTSSRSFSSLFSNSTFRALFLSEGISLLGDRIVAIALIMLVYEQTQSATTISILMMLKAFPALFFGTIAGGIVDRFSKKWIMVISNIVQGLLIATIPLTHSTVTIFTIYLIISTINQLFIPARAATIPDIVSADELMSANAVFSLSYVGAIALGPALGGILIEAFGLNTAFYIDAFTFFVPALIVSFLVLPSSAKPETQTRFLDEVRGSFHFILRDVDLLISLLLSGAVYIGIGSMSVLGIVLAEEVLHVGAGGYGAMMSAMGTGLFVGALVLGKSKKTTHEIRIAIIGSLISGFTIILLPFATSIYFAFPLTFVIGLGTIMVQISANTFFQRAPETHRGKIIGVSQSFVGAASFAAMGLAGFLTDFIGLYWVFAIAGSTSMLAGIIGFVLKRRDRSIDSPT